MYMPGHVGLKEDGGAPSPLLPLLRALCGIGGLAVFDIFVGLSFFKRPFACACVVRALSGFGKVEGLVHLDGGRKGGGREAFVTTLADGPRRVLRRWRAGRRGCGVSARLGVKVLSLYPSAEARSAGRL